MAASARSLRYRGVAEALRTTFRTGLGLNSRPHRVYAAEECEAGEAEDEEEAKAEGTEAVLDFIHERPTEHIVEHDSHDWHILHDGEGTEVWRRVN